MCGVCVCVGGGGEWQSCSPRSPGRMGDVCVCVGGEGGGNYCSAPASDCVCVCVSTNFAELAIIVQHQLQTVCVCVCVHACVHESVHACVVFCVNLV